MAHEHRVGGWLRRHWPRSTLPQHHNGHDGTPNTANSVHFMPPAAVEALPPYSPPAEDLLPALETAMSTTPSEVPLPTPSEPPPDYQPNDQSQSPSAPALSRGAELAHLSNIFSRFPWRRSWGPQPTSFAHALNKAALLGHHRLILALLDVGAQVGGNQHQAVQTTTPVHEALRGPEPWLAQAFLSRLCSAGGHAHELLGSRDSVGCTPLHIAAEAGETAIARSFILFHGAEVDAVDRLGRTPLHMTARYGRTETMDMLLSCGADPARVNEKLWLCVNGNKQMSELLGSHALISSSLRAALERHQETWGRDIDRGHPEAEMGGEEEEDEGPSIRETRPSSAQVAPKFPPLIPVGTSYVQRPQSQPPLSLRPNTVPRPRLHRASLRSSSFPDRAAEKLAVAYGHNEVEAAQRVLNHLTRSLTSQRSVSSMLFSPEYAIWKTDCETVQGESRAQKERNRRETGNALDLY